ncbi:hypothetical protein HJC23_008428 [Cyclotella cryptica]|uniref:Thioredoxin reductase n=1 Tax=Cyclotella cryptica TaxID=29204 RepID=A0ABD3PXQ8_9STRA
MPSSFPHPNKHFSRVQRSMKHSSPSTTTHYVDLPPASDQILYDAIIVGCGPAGLTAALFASRMGMSVLVLGSLSGGSLAGTDVLDNFPSYVHAPGAGRGGRAWLQATMDQAGEFGARFAPPTVVATGLKRMGETWIVSVDGHDHDAGGSGRDVRSRTVIVASGSLPRRLDLTHESELWGRSLHNCALCDGEAYGSRSSRGDSSSSSNNSDSHGSASTNNDKSVAVIGGGDAAVEAVSLLARIGVHTIHWIHRREEFKANAAEVERVRKLPNVQTWTSFVVVEWIVKQDTRHDGETVKILDGVRIVGSKDGMADPGATSSLTIPCDGAFLMIGSTPNTKWLESSGVEMDDAGLIRFMSRDAGNHDGTPFLPSQTSMAGVFAAGEAVDGMYRQALTAASDGAKSAMDAERYLRFYGAATITPFARERAAESRETRTDDYDDHDHDDETHPRINCDLSHSSCISQVVSEHPVVVFGKSFCSYCHRALEALEAEGAKPLNLQIDYMKNGRDVQDILSDMTGRRTVPNVFVGGKTIGGGQETVELHESGELRKLLQAANAI